MATYYVDSNATGADNGGEGNDAWKTLAQAVGVAKGSVVLIADDHSETSATALILDFTNSTAAEPVIIISVDFDDSYSYSPGATVATDTNGNLDIDGDVRVYGLTLDSDDDAVIGGIHNYQVYEDCTFQVDDYLRTGGADATTEFINCTINCDKGGSGGALDTADRCITIYRNCAITHPNVGRLIAQASSACVIFEDCDLSVDTDTIAVLNLVSRTSVILRRCKMTVGWATEAAIAWPGTFILVEGCSSSTNLTVAELGLTEYVDMWGTVKSDLTRYRTGGADDDENANAHSWEMVSSANALEIHNPLKTPPMMRWVEAGVEVTVTLYVASGVTLQDDEFWIELSGSDNTANPNTTTQGYTATTRAAIQATPANLTTDAVSTWNGVGVGTKQECSVTFTPAEAGPVVVRACLAKASTTVYIDPRLDVT